ncbi:uncharacterized protein [Apostichopus japonicus]|uniref:uncharacterized protein isoform X4 n=1 Tax=Stichopus japonicus TaxID=307972 RepID=UPI003AB52877
MRYTKTMPDLSGYDVALPVFHAYGHKFSCQLVFLLTLLGSGVVRIFLAHRISTRKQAATNDSSSLENMSFCGLLKQPENEEEATDSDVRDNSVVPAATNDSSSLENMSFCGLLKKHTQTDCNNKTDGKYSVSESDEDAHKPLQQRQGCPQRLSQCPFCSKTLAGSQLSRQKEIKNHFN